MKIFITADIEGITGTSHWDETGKNKPEYPEFQEQMTAEVVAACEGALNAGATEIWVKDAHGSARNLIAAKLPREVRLLRGWSGHPYMMMDGIDSSFQAAMMIGYHSRAGSDANPLSHTISGADSYVKINDRFASEFLMNSYTAGLVKVPVVFVSGDAGLCEDATSFIPALGSVAVKQGLGNLTNNIHPQLSVELIRKGAEKAIKGNLALCQVKMPDHFTVEMRYKEHAKARQVSYFPGVSMIDSTAIKFESNDYYEVLRLFMFVF
jgi:D-amino peptidase